MLKVSTFCSGIGSPEVAMKNLGIEHEVVLSAEIDKYARQTYLANHDTKKMINDMTVPDYEGEEWYSDINVSGLPCFKAGTLITTANGLVAIEDIKAGDYVLTHNNRFRSVVVPMRKYSKKILDIKIQGSPLIEATEEHPFYVREMSRKWNNEKGRDERVFSEPKWVDAKDLVVGKHFVGFGMNHKSENIHNLNEEECWFLGRYMADGYLTSRAKRTKTTDRNLYKISICVGYKKVENFPSFETIKTTPSKERTVTKFHSYNKRLHELCVQIGRGSANKQIPSFIMNLPVHMLKIFLEGYLSGDGSEKDGKYSLTTVSKKLAYSFSQAVYKCYQTPTSITFTKRLPTCVIEGRTVNQKDTYRVQFCKEKRKQNNGIFIDENIWQPVKSVIANDEYNDYVYNFEVDEDNSYVAENCIVHNCQAFSLAGKRLGELDPRGLLFFDFYRYVKNQKPKYFIVENVKGLLSMDEGAVFQNWINLLGQSVNGDQFMFPHEDSLMYNLHWQVLNTKDYGLPQNRERVFLIGIRNDLPNDFVFPKTVPLKLRLKDVLEDSVDEKYYLSYETIDKVLNSNFNQERSRIQTEDICDTLLSRDYKDPKCVQVKSATKSGYEIAEEGDSVNLEHPNSETRRGRVGKQVAQTLTTSCNQGVVEKELKIGAFRGRNPQNPNDRTTGAPTEQMLEINENGTSNCLTSVQKDNVVVEQIGRGYNKGGFHTISPPITSNSWQENHRLHVDYRIRKLTTREVFRLQGFPDEFHDKAVAAGVSNSQLYKQAGNSISVPVIQAILKNLLK